MQMLLGSTLDRAITAWLLAAEQHPLPARSALNRMHYGATVVAESPHGTGRKEPAVLILAEFQQGGALCVVDCGMWRLLLP